MVSRLTKLDRNVKSSCSRWQPSKKMLHLTVIFRAFRILLATPLPKYCKTQTKVTSHSSKRMCTSCLRHVSITRKDWMYHHQSILVSLRYGKKTVEISRYVALADFHYAVLRAMQTCFSHYARNRYRNVRILRQRKVQVGEQLLRNVVHIRIEIRNLF